MSTKNLLSAHYYFYDNESSRWWTLLPNINETEEGHHTHHITISFIIFSVKYNFQNNSKYFSGTFRTQSQLAFTYFKPAIETLEKVV